MCRYKEDAIKNLFQVGRQTRVGSFASQRRKDNGIEKKASKCQAI